MKLQELKNRFYTEVKKFQPTSVIYQSLIIRFNKKTLTKFNSSYM